MNGIIFHIGLHKTATTTMQRHVFPSWPGLRDVSRDATVRQFIADAVLTDPAYFESGRWSNSLDRLRDPTVPTIVSSESLSGSLYAGAVKRGLDHRTPILQNVRSVFPDARIVLVLRRQDGLARSLYRQYLKVGGCETVESFYGYNSSRSALFPHQRFHYKRYVDLLHGLFPGKVHIQTYEDFQEQPELFLKALGEFIGIAATDAPNKRSNESRLSSFGMEVSRISNYLCRSRFNPSGLLPGVPVVRKGHIRLVNVSSVIHNNWPRSARLETDLSGRIDRVCRQILDESTADNRSLEESYRLGLETHGYF